MGETKKSNKKTKEAPKSGTSQSGFSKLQITLAGIFLAVAVLYFLMGNAYRDVFFPGTIINGVNVSGLNLAGAQAAINTLASDYILTIGENGDDTEQISGKAIGLCLEDKNSLRSLLDSQIPLTWGLQAFREKEYTLNMQYDQEKLHSAIEALDCMDKGQWTAPENAYITYDKDSGYKIVPEVAGTEILPDKLYEAAAEAVCRLEDTLLLNEVGVYKPPRYSFDDPTLAERLALFQGYSDMTVTYQFGSRSEVLDGNTLSEWISLNKSGKRSIDREAVVEYVKSLAKKYNTAYSSKTLETSYGEMVTIKNGYYGWMIDKEAEVNALMEIIRNGESTSREPAYLLEAESHDGPDYGNTYVEINLTAQHLFFYKDGELIVESDFVSGNPSRGNATPDGAYSLTYKEQNATLKGENYRTPVSYWMPFNGNIGMHDSSWRSTFGASIYKTNGSHGCINLPPSVAETIFENIEQGIPVLCYHLSGTEQKQATNLSGEKVSVPAVPSVPATPEPPVVLPPQDGTVLPPQDGTVLPPQDGTVLPPPDVQVLPENGADPLQPPAQTDVIP